ncbi:pentapeptide repeat-containing protein [Nostoc sp. LEGE 06077]|uniref:pentapeptide repeat-containing protein n=1 Tax=Nostoc sp. LEGE 06077 TaxID=915325 RepID=UPI001882A209|nr:pentapeptide repeat-containing protein [Nostoc sp. LEGE 06077]MBE9209698.1 pentapeptide repeat-containing protein [Nostoc sp. LEGE 06077]
MSEWREKLTNLIKSLPNKQKLFIGVFIAAGVITILYQFNWSGFGEDSNKSVAIREVINPKNGTIIKLTETTENFQSGKTFWDWLGLASTLAIPIVLFQFERREQRRADKRAQEEKESAEKQAEVEKAIADKNLREEALESYIDRMSQLLLDKNFKTLDIKNPLRDAALDVARARTLSVLRRLDKDSERKGNVIEFLIDAELISELNLSGAKLESANLESVNLINAKLESADLTSANLINAKLESADLTSANLKDAELFCAKLKSADLTSANLASTNLRIANLESANLNGAYLNGAYLNGAYLNGAYFIDADLTGADLTGADLTGADLTGATNITIDQIKSAMNWEKAKYDKDFCTQLDLPPE